MKLLFVCTGNIFRSMSAEYLAKKYIKDNKIKGIEISSAGTIANPESPFSYTIKNLEKYWCDSSLHRQTKLTSEVLEDKDFVICMAQHHLDRVRELLYEWMLFNFLAYGKKDDVMDEAEYEEKHWSYGDLEDYVKTIVDYIHDAMPKIFEWLDNLEIERKWFVRELPSDYKSLEKYEIIQWYCKNEKWKNIRIRKQVDKKWNTKFFETRKKWDGLIKKEIEKEIAESEFDNLWKKVWNWYLEKTRYIMPYQWHEIEIDVYKWKNNWLIVAEVEFESWLEAKKFIFPDWFGEELTGNKEYSNVNLAKR